MHFVSADNYNALKTHSTQLCTKDYSQLIIYHLIIIHEHFVAKKGENNSRTNCRFQKRWLLARLGLALAIPRIITRAGAALLSSARQDERKLPRAKNAGVGQHS